MLDILRPANSTIATAERRGSVNISSAKTFLFKMTHPQRYKREQQEELQQLSYSASVASFKSEIHPPQDDDTASDKDVNVNDASSTMSLPVSPSAPAQLQQQLPPPSMPQQQGAMLFQPSPEYFDHLDSSETTHADSYFPQPRAPTAVSGATVRSSLFRRSMMFLEKPEDEDFTSFLAFGHTSSAVQSLGNDSTLSISSLTSFSTTSSSTSSSVRPAFFTRSSTSETSTPPASSPATSPRTSINLGYPTRPVLSKAGTGGSSKTTSGFGLAAALAGTTSVSTAMAGVVHGSSSNVDGTSAESMIVDDGASVFSIGSIQSAASEECRGSSIRGRNGFVKKLGLKK
ncbi:hypothetical protein BG004_000026 [Podila humilis]|nr:hypothetical protein BG004_000026 [Podila humilis]